MHCKLSRYYLHLQGQAKNWTVSLLESDPMADTFVNATVLGKSPNTSLSIYCSPGFGKAYNDSGTVPTVETALWKSGTLHILTMQHDTQMSKSLLPSNESAIV